MVREELEKCEGRISRCEWGRWDRGRDSQAGRSALHGMGLTAVVVLAMGLTGCAAGGEWLVRRTQVEVAPARTNFIPLVVTNTVVEQVWTTNVVSGVVEERAVARPVVVTNFQAVVLPPVSYEALAPSGLLQNATQGAGRAAGMLGVPWADTIGTGLFAAASVVLGFLNRRNRRKAEAEAAGREVTQGALVTAQLVGETLVENLETLRKTALTIPGYTRELDDKVMTLIQAAQAAAGREVKAQIGKMVEEKTEFTLPGK